MARRPLLFVLPDSMGISARHPSSVDLVGWKEGKMLTGEWLDGGGPLDATHYLPAGSVRQHDGGVGMAFISHVTTRGQY